MAVRRRAILMLTPDQHSLDRRIAQEARTLAGHGWEVDIFPTHLPLDPPAEMLAPGVRMLPRPEQPRASRARRLKHSLRDAAPRLHRVADTVQSLVTDRAGQIADWNSSHLLDHGPYEVVFAHDIPVLPLAIRLRSRWGCAVVCDLHELYSGMETTASSPRTRSYWRRIEAEYLPMADGILCVNAAIREYALGLPGVDAPIEVVPNSVPYVADPRSPGRSIRDLYGIAGDRRVLAFAGRLVPDTNLETLVRGFIGARLDGWVLAVLGSGPLLDRLRSIVEGSELGDRIFMGRRVPEPELVAVLSAAQVGAIPYLPVDPNHLISTPNKLFEYAQARLPIAASRLPMIERLVLENRDGGFVDYSDPDETAATLRQFIERDLPSISREALEAAARNLSWERDEAALLWLFDSVVAGRR
jgi:glycosyltransferase involved in cell wall biosynthesis